MLSLTPIALVKREIGDEQGLLCDLGRACFHVSAGPVLRPSGDRWRARKAPIAAAPWR